MTQERVVGIDIGGTNTAFGTIDRLGNISASGTLPTTGHADLRAYIAAIKASIYPLMERAGLGNFVGVGVGAPNGNFYTGEIMFAPNLPWHGVLPMAQLIGEALGISAVLTNDANAAAIGEMTYGAAKGMKDFVMVTLGTGLGSGFVANGQLIYGHDGFAGELGHIIAVRDGRMCGCGRNGCLETYASATGIARSAEIWLAENERPTLLRTKQGHITAKDIHDAALLGDKVALQLFEYTGKILGQCLADMVAITSPQAIILFGGLANAGHLLLDPVKEHMNRNLLEIFRNKIDVVLSALPGTNAAILGASALAW